jgi:5-methylcytosine-specific restriction endonuclease McrA
MKKLARIRGIRFRQQNGRCHYCEQQMWTIDRAEFARKHRISKKQANHLQATAEHLVPRSEGGKDEKANIVAACRFCNSHRHYRKVALAADVFQKWVRTRMARGKWHPTHLVIL